MNERLGDSCQPAPFRDIAPLCLLGVQAWGAVLKSVKSCGTDFLHRHVAAETAAAVQYVVHEHHAGHLQVSADDGLRSACL